MTVDQAGLMQWLDDARAAYARGDATELLNIDGYDVFSILLAPLFMAVLKAVRAIGPESRVGPAQVVRTRFRSYAYRLKQALLERRAVRISARPAEADVLFWPRDITHIDAQQPVAAAAREAGLRTGFLACSPRICHLLAARHLAPCFTVAAWPDLVRRARRDGLQQARRLAVLPQMELPPLPESAAGDSQASARVAHDLRRTLVEWLPVARESVVNAQAALDRFAPRVLAVGYDITPEGRAGALVAARRGVATVSLMHGNVTANPLQGRHCVDRFLAYGEAGRRELIRWGQDPARVAVCGAPYLDGRPRQSGRTDEMIQARLAIDAAAPWALVATSGPGHGVSHEHHRQVIRNLMALSMALPDLPILVKLHRKDQLEYYRQELRIVAGSRLRLAPQNDLGLPADFLDWLQGCRLLLTGASTAAVEAMLLDVPVVSMDFRGELAGVDFVDAGATLHVESYSELESAVRRVIDQPESLVEMARRREAYLRQAFLALDGRSSARAVAELQSLAGVLP